MDHVAPLKLMEEVEAASCKKAALTVNCMLLKGFMSGALLAYATALAFRVTEFLPVSSSAHLVIFQNLFGVKEPQLFLDVVSGKADVFFAEPSQGMAFL